MDQLEQYKQQIVDAALPHVPFDGWTDAVLKKAAQEAGIDPGYVRIVFPRGPLDAIAWHSAQADAAMAEYIHTLPLDTLPLPVKVRKAVLWRLQRNLPRREAIRKALAVLSFPVNGLTALKLLYDTVDTIWKEIGDHPTDFSYYTKRMTLAGIYSATLAYWLEDHSEGQKDTEAFLDRRLGEVRAFGKWKKQCLTFIPSFPGFSQKAS